LQLLFEVFDLFEGVEFAFIVIPEVEEEVGHGDVGDGGECVVEYCEEFSLEIEDLVFVEDLEGDVGDSSFD
jgi:hypothetical protein